MLNSYLQKTIKWDSNRIPTYFTNKELVELNFEYRRERQNNITEELNDIISIFKVISKDK